MNKGKIKKNSFKKLKLETMMTERAILVLIIHTTQKMKREIISFTEIIIVAEETGEKYAKLERHNY